MAQSQHNDQASQKPDRDRIILRDTVVGREAFVRRTRFKVWQVESLARAYDYHTSAIAKHLGLDAGLVEEAIS